MEIEREAKMRQQNKRVMTRMYGLYWVEKEGYKGNK